MSLAMRKPNASLSLVAHLAIFVLGLPAVAAARDDAKPAATVEMNALEKQFAASLNGVDLVGYSTRDDKDIGKVTPDRYSIEEIVKVDATHWRIKAGIKMGPIVLTLPLLMEVQWAGDTPVLTLTDFSIGPLGTFTARVLFFRGRYAGTWSHGGNSGGNKAGGQIFGQIIPKTAKAKAPEAKTPDAKEPTAKDDSKKTSSAPVSTKQ